MCCSNGIEYTIWDRWEVHGNKGFTLKQFIQTLQVKCITGLLRMFCSTTSISMISCRYFARAADRLKILIAINRVIKIFTRDKSHQNKKHKFMAQNGSIIHDITSIA